MLNLKAAKELAARELGNTPRKAADSVALDKVEKSSSSIMLSSRRRPSSAKAESSVASASVDPEMSLTSYAPFAVGDRVEYCSDTHKQWLPGVVQRVRDGGKIYDLDVKKGAHVSKLRAEPSGSARIFDQIDKNNDGVISRFEFQSALDRHVISSQPSPKSVPTRQIGAAAAPLQARGGYETAIKPRQTEAHDELALRRDQLAFDEYIGRDMISRAGAVTVRKLAQTTKSLLHDLEERLIERVGVVAGCFNMWRFEVQLMKAAGTHREELEQHHDAWAAHFKSHQESFEEMLRKSAEHQMTAKEKRRQQAEMIVDQWAEGDRKGLMRSVFRVYSQYATGERRRKRAATQIHTAVFGWAEGKTKGTAHACLLSWRHEAALQRETRAKDAELAKLKSSYQDSEASRQAQRDREMAQKLNEIQARMKDHSSNVKSIMVQWEKGKAKGSILVAWQAWSNYSKGRKARERCQHSMQMQMRKWVEGESKGIVHTCFLCWKGDWEQRRLAEEIHGAGQQQKERLEQLLADERQRHKDELQIRQSEAERRKAAAKAQSQYILAKWGMGDKKGTQKSVFAAWNTFTRDEKSSARKRQAVHAALTKAFMGDLKGAAHVALLNWSTLAKSEKMERLREKAEAETAARWQNYAQKAEEEQQAILQAAYDSQKALRARAHHTTEMLVKQWLGGGEAEILKTFFHDWKQYVEAKTQAELQRQSVKDAVFRFIEGDQHGCMHICLTNWQNYVQNEAAHQKVSDAMQSKIDQLERQVEGFLDQRMAHLKKFGQMMGSNQTSVLKRMCFTSWKEESAGAAAQLEHEREQEVLMEEMRRQHEMAETKKKERQALALEALGFKRERLQVLTQFEAWAYVYEQAKDERIKKLTHNQQMLRYSKFLISQKFKEDDKGLLTSTFAAWNHEAKLMFHQNSHGSTQEQLEAAMAEIQLLEQQRADMQDQLQLQYQQIDLITETLQKELKTKEELASELRDAYDKMRQKNEIQMATPSTMASSDAGNLFSRGGSLGGSFDFRSHTKDHSPGRARKPSAASTAPVVKGSKGDSSRLPIPEDSPPALPQSRSARSSRGGLDCDWVGAVRRMEEEGILHSQRYD
eukprot:TRINITY_DN36556_c0_g1_i1.p1 TRINITY_DN36556_c0_g1~~TRINITY_DN36556_c0_g1_i1.p1  ORF type:complete len:1096 (+),score=251.38 TRINITY_DN36556_c0_g1_i1:96-3383(+)